MNSLQFLSDQVDRVISRSSKASQRLGDEQLARHHSLVDIATQSSAASQAAAASSSEEAAAASATQGRPPLRRSQTLDTYQGVGAHRESGYDGLFKRPFEDIESLASTIRRIGSFIAGQEGPRAPDTPQADQTQTPSAAPAGASSSAGHGDASFFSSGGEQTPSGSGTATPVTPRQSPPLPALASHPQSQPHTPGTAPATPTTTAVGGATSLPSSLYYFLTLSFIWDTLRYMVSQHPAEEAPFLVRVFRWSNGDAEPEPLPERALAEHLPQRVSEKHHLHLTREIPRLTPETDTDVPQTPSTTMTKRRAKKSDRPKFRYPKSLLHPARSQNKTLILDLDETLIHSMSRGSKISPGHMVEVRLDRRHATMYYVHKRPYCDDFLKLVSKWFNVVVFTASVQEYADPVIDWLEQEQRFFTKRYYRQHCTKRGNGYVKDITCVDKDLSKLMIIDNSPVSYMFHENNAIGIEGWINDPTDIDLLCLLPVLNALRYTIDVRHAISLRLGDGALTEEKGYY